MLVHDKFHVGPDCFDPCCLDCSKICTKIEWYQGNIKNAILTILFFFPKYSPNTARLPKFIASLSQKRLQTDCSISQRLLKSRLPTHFIEPEVP